MQPKVPPTLAELEDCRKKIIHLINEMQISGDGQSPEIYTIKNGLEKIEELIAAANTPDIKNDPSEPPAASPIRSLSVALKRLKVKR